MKTTIIILVFLLFILSSCSIQKRLYNKGFYTSKSHTIKNHEVEDTTKAVSLLSVIKEIKKKNNVPLFAMAAKAIEVINKTRPTYSAPIPNIKQTLLHDPCDTIVMKNGIKVLGNITKVTSVQILFKKCNTQSDSSFSIQTVDVADIYYTNGIIGSYKSHRSNAMRKLAKGFLIAGLITFLLGVTCLIIVFSGRMYASLQQQLLLLLFMLIFLLASVILLIISLVLLLISKRR